MEFVLCSWSSLSLFLGSFLLFWSRFFGLAILIDFLSVGFFGWMLCTNQLQCPKRSYILGRMEYLSSPLFVEQDECLQTGRCKQSDPSHLHEDGIEWRDWYNLRHTRPEWTNGWSAPLISASWRHTRKVLSIIAAMNVVNVNTASQSFICHRKELCAKTVIGWRCLLV